MLHLGLTGSIGMGKSTAAALLREMGVPVFDSDASVHALYAGRAAPLIAAAFPGTVENGVVDRVKLGAAVLNKPEAMARLEAIVHPLVREEERRFLDEARRKGDDIVASDIPLLFETGQQARFDKVLVVSAPESVQKLRVLARPGMTEAKLAAILARQLPDAEKRKRADIVIGTGESIEATRAELAAYLGVLRAGKKD